MFADRVNEADLELVFRVVGFALLLGAAYLGYLRNIAGAGVVALIGVLVLILLA